MAGQVAKRGTLIPSSTLQKPPSLLSYLHLLYKSKSYLNISFSFLILFFLHFTKKLAFTIFLLHLNFNHLLQKHHLGLHLHLKQPLPSIGIVGYIAVAQLGNIVDNDLFGTRQASINHS